MVEPDQTDAATPEKDPEDVVSEVLSSWSMTARLCVVLLMATPLAAGAVGVLVVVRG
ncbi:hypothetical protein ACWEFJ_30285 [Actinosynnema sp. NPDC004786]